MVQRNDVVQYCEEILTQAMNVGWLDDCRSPCQLIRFNVAFQLPVLKPAEISPQTSGDKSEEYSLKLESIFSIFVTTSWTEDSQYKLAVIFCANADDSSTKKKNSLPLVSEELWLWGSHETWNFKKLVCLYNSYFY